MLNLIVLRTSHKAEVVLGLIVLLGSNVALNAQFVQQTLRQESVKASQLRTEGDFDGALKALGLALELCDSEKTTGLRARILLRTGILEWNLGDISGSARSFTKAGSLFKAIRDPRSYEYCAKCLELIRLYDLARNDRAAKLYRRSLGKLEKGLSLAREIGLPDFELKCLRQKSMAHIDLRELDSFLEANLKGLAIALKISHQMEKGRCLNNLGAYYQQHSDYFQAAKYYERALSAAHAGSDKDVEAGCLSNLGIVCRELGDFDRAYYYLSQALKLDLAFGKFETVALDLVNIGSVSLRRGLDGGNRQDLQRALEEFKSSLSYLEHEKDTGLLVRFTALNNIGVILNELGDCAGARIVLTEARALADRDYGGKEISHVLINIAASFLCQNDVGEAKRLFELARRSSARNGLKNVLIESSFGLGQCYERNSDPTSALAYYLQAIDTIEQLGNRINSEPLLMGFARNKTKPYERAIDILADRYAHDHAGDKLEDIFNLMERFKAQAFLEILSEVWGEPSDTDAAFIDERRKAISQNIAELFLRMRDEDLSLEGAKALANEIALEEEEYVRLSAKFGKLSPELTRASRGRILSLNQIQEMLPGRGTVLLEYFLGDHRSYLLRVSKTTVRLHWLPPRKQIESSLRGYLKFTADRFSDPRDGLDASERIGRELLPFDADEQLKEATSLIIVPDGILHYLPFDAIRYKEGTISRYLVENKALSLSPSSASLGILWRATSSGIRAKQVIAVGAPDYGARGFSPQDKRSQGPIDSEIGPAADFDGIVRLPNSKREIMDIIRHFPSGSVDVLLGKSATEKAIRSLNLADYRILHFACHAFLNERYPYRSALVLTRGDGSDENDGLLQMREIYTLTMNADLVVLSACQSGRGRLERSEGPVGIARPFFFSGARSVIASLWPVNDRSTLSLMNKFYGGLTNGLLPAEALRRAKAAMLKSKWYHPFYWASFVLQGDPFAAKLAK